MIQTISIAGIPIPSRNAWFLTGVAIHVAAGLVAVIAGVFAMLSAKSPGRHPRSGTVYFCALVVVSVTATALAAARWPADRSLALLGAVALTVAYLGRQARRSRWQRWRDVHIWAMGLSYVTLLTAFYVDNGPHLPGWKHLPTIAFWIVPSAVGLPVIFAAWRNNTRETGSVRTSTPLR